MTTKLKRLKIAGSGVLLSILAIVFYSSISDTVSPPSGMESGYTPADIQVSERGALSFSHSFFFTPGTGGMAPSMGMSYNSQAGNSITGIGFSLAGLSSITRGPCTIQQDGFKDAVDFDDNDKYMLDGVRLVPVRTTVQYIEYRTETYNGSRIRAYGQIGLDPEYWVVETKDGIRNYYGASDNSRILGQGRRHQERKILNWTLEKAEDTKGNYFKVTYLHDTTKSFFAPQEINYTGNEAAGLAPYAKVRFEYEGRPDTTLGYLSGSKVATPLRLKTVAHTINGINVSRYELKYEEVGEAQLLSRLTSITEKRYGANGEMVVGQANGGNIFTFEWSGEGRTPRFGEPRVWMRASDIGIDVRTDHPARMAIADINNDGLQDIAWHPHKKADELHVAYSNGSSFDYQGGARYRTVFWAETKVLPT